MSLQRWRRASPPAQQSAAQRRTNVHPAHFLPALHFLLAGALLFALSHSATPPTGAPPSVTLAARETSVEDLLADAALARGYDQDDPVVQRRLVRNMAFLDGDGCDPPALYREALGLGLGGSDLVVRRRLAQRMRLTLEDEARAVEPSDAELTAYLAAHAERFALPPRATVTQVFLHRRRGPRLAADARRLREQLASGAAPEGLGDALPLPGVLTCATTAQLAAWLGPAVAAAAFDAPLGQWRGPVASPYGAHLLRVDQRLPAELPPLAGIRTAVRAAWLDARGAAAVDDAVRVWRSAGPGQPAAGSGSAPPAAISAAAASQGAG